jgi:biopolymer transport protein TolR
MNGNGLPGLQRDREKRRSPRMGRPAEAGIVMAFGRLERREGPQPMSDINVTPLVDVMLVLVVIFIITAPLMASSIRLDLPRAEGAQPGARPRLSLCGGGQGRPGLPGRPAAHAR